MYNVCVKVWFHVIHWYNVQCMLKIGSMLHVHVYTLYSVQCMCIYIYMVQCTMYVLKFGSMLHVYIELMQISPFPLPPSGGMTIVMTLHAGCPTALGTYRPIDCRNFFILHV